MTVTRSLILILAAIAMFVLAALVFFTVIHWTLDDGLGIASIGLACFAAASLP